MYIAFIIVMSLIPSPPEIDPTESDIFAHLFTYLLLMLWFSNLYPVAIHRRLAGSFIVLGMTLEILQGFSGYREFEFVDILANSTGIMTAWWIARTFRRPLPSET